MTVHDTGLAAIAGRVVDLDSHEMIPTHMWAESFGAEAVDAVMPIIEPHLKRMGVNSPIRDDLQSDAVEISQETVWDMKGPGAPSAIDMARRPEVMDEMGIDRQLLFPTFALIGINLAHNPNVSTQFRFDPAEFDAPAAGLKAIDGYNDWAAHIQKAESRDRLRPVAVIPSRDVATMIADAEKALASGLRALWLPSVPPGGTSPGDMALDPFWSIAEEADVPVVLHVGTEFGFASPDWHANVPQFTYGMKDSIEFPIEPFRGSTIHFAIEAYLGAMILGGVFERHPRLRFGVVECGAHWVGPLAEKLDLWAEQFRSRLGDVLTMKPSEYLARNVRVTPFYFEKVDMYFSRHPQLSDVFAYGSDFPHLEGGKSSMRLLYDQLLPLGSDVIDKFFVRNGAWLLAH